MVTIMLDMPDEQAQALAQMVKRFCWHDARLFSSDEKELREILDGVTALRRALAREGYAPR